jgi:poly(3-hydroxybutyrate) depolymerase|tara:strand:+ start:249 stop:1124 length:876 start_codon:yes stop_codon:yes gene_type:complete
MIKFNKHIFVLALLACISSYAMADTTSYKFSKWAGSELPVFFASPTKITKATRLVVVMHGRKRNAAEYRDQWQEAAEDLNLLVIVPEFSEQNFPEVWGFNYGNVKTENLISVEESLQAFSAIEPLAEEAIKKFKLRSKNWGIYGHGAGAHFVHRYALYRPDASYTLAIAANLGWYLSMTDEAWPFGLRDSGIDDQQLKKAFSKYFLLMLGRADTSTKPNTPYVAEHFNIIKLQGEHRLARGRNFFKSAVTKSKELDEFFKWGMVEVPTTKGHSNTKQMVPYAAEMFYARLR